MDPYKVLGITPSASDDEVKKAYKALAKKYHPDMNVGATNIKELEARFKKIQEAYNLIMDQRTNGGSSYNSGNGYGWYDSGYGQAHRNRTSSADSYTIEMQAAANFINSRRFSEAINVLNSINDRTAQWYYFSALANAGLGNNIKAREHAQKASAMDPNNVEYRFLAIKLDNANAAYTGRGQTYQRPIFAGGNLCCYCIGLNLLCNCCCRGGGF